jgi:hypothetical protein
VRLRDFDPKQLTDEDRLRYGSSDSTRSAMDARVEEARVPAARAPFCTPTAAERAPRVISLRPSDRARTAPEIASALAVRPALASTRLAAALTVALFARVATFMAFLEAARAGRFFRADRPFLRPAAWLTLAADLLDRLRFSFAICVFCN